MESLAGVAGAHGLRHRAQSAAPSAKSDAAVAPAPADGGGEPADDCPPREDIEFDAAQCAKTFVYEALPGPATPTVVSSTRDFRE